MLGPCDLEAGGSRSSSLGHSRFPGSAIRVPSLQSSSTSVVIMPPHASGGDDKCVGESGRPDSSEVQWSVSLDSANRRAETGYSIHLGMSLLDMRGLRGGSRLRGNWWIVGWQDCGIKAGNLPGCALQLHHSRCRYLSRCRDEHASGSSR